MIRIPDPRYVLFFGCHAVSGHFLHMPDCWRTERSDMPTRLEDTPWDVGLDGGLLTQVPDVPDWKWVHNQKDGWTAVSFWDRSGDKRPKSNSAFVIRQLITGEELLKLARIQWPQIFQRKDFPI